MSLSDIRFDFSGMEDFTIGKDNFSDLEIKEENGFFYFYDTKNRRLIKYFILGETETAGIKTRCDVTLIAKGDKFTPRLAFSKRKGKEIKKESDNGDRQITSRTDLQEYHENFWKLIDYIQGIKNIDVPREGIIAISRDKASLLKMIENLDEINDFYASIRQEKNKKSLKELAVIFNNPNHSEDDLNKWIERNDWVFGIEYIEKLDKTRIGINEDSDMLVASLDGFADLIELKKDIVKLFNFDESHKCYYMTASLSQVIGQTVNYLKVMEDQRFNLAEQHNGFPVLKPRAKIVIGRSKDFNNEERKTLRELNDTLHNIEVLTYDDIINRAKMIINLYSKKENDSAK